MMGLKRTKLTKLCEHAMPEQWTKIITASRVIKIIRDKEPSYLYEKLTNAYFEEHRYPGLGFVFVSSKTKKGHQLLPNQLLFMRSI
jgi:hypothetical protein